MSLDAADFATRRLVHPCRWQQHAANERRTPLAAERTAVLRPFYNGHPTAASNCTTPRARRCAPAVSSGSASCGHLQFLAGMDSGCLEADRPATVAEVEPDVAAADLVASVDARRAEAVQNRPAHFARRRVFQRVERVVAELFGKAQTPVVRAANLGVDGLRDAARAVAIRRRNLIHVHP